MGVLTKGVKKSERFDLYGGIAVITLWTDYSAEIQLLPDDIEGVQSVTLCVSGLPHNDSAWRLLKSQLPESIHDALL